jgi:predicted transposase/invertase (TIGR01784 family)
MKKRALNPLADPIFKRIFGEEKEILMELINAVMQLEHPVVNIEYLPPELLPENIDKKTTVVDVRCTDDVGRHFIVEMQVARQKSLKKRVFFNAARVYGRQIAPGDDYDMLQPIFALCLADHIIEHNTDRWKHKYIIINEDDPSRCINQLEMHFIELSKCRKRINFNYENPLDRWLKYLIDPEFIKSLTMNAQYNYPNLKKAVELLDESNYTEGQLVAYDRYLDSIRTWNSSMKLSYEEGVDEGRAAGKEEGRAEGKAEGIKQGAQNLSQALKDLKAGKSIEEVAETYGFDLSLIQDLYQNLMKD